VVDIPKRLDPAIRDRRDGDDIAGDGYGDSSFPVTSSSRLGTNTHTSWAMNFT
jgi:hypothetical protein